MKTTGRKVVILTLDSADVRKFDGVSAAVWPALVHTHIVSVGVEAGGPLHSNDLCKTMDFTF